MRLSTRNIWCVCALAAFAGLTYAQDSGPILNGPTVAKKKSSDSTDSTTTGTPTDDSTLPKIPSAYSKKDKPDMTNAPSFKTQVDIVTLDAAVVDAKGQFIPGIPPQNFRVLEDNVPQKIQKVDLGQAPLTIALLIEFSGKFQQLYGPTWRQTLQLSWGFASTLKPDDYMAVIAYDIKPEILTDFTTNRQQTQQALSRLTIPAWQEANLFDALTDTADRMSGIEGRKAILVLTSGIDTFSKITFDKARKSLQEAGVPVYAISLMQFLRTVNDDRMGPVARMDFLQADNELRTFSKETGGRSFFPRFEGEYPGIFQDIQQALRNEYVITYLPSNKAHDGAFRKLKVDLVNPATNEPIILKDEKGKPIKYSVIAKPGYKAPRAVE
jgi:Ca-activated chloride channel family protein